MFEGYLNEIDSLDEQIPLFDGSNLTDDELEMLLTTWRAYDGFEWTRSGEWIELYSYLTYWLDDTLYCMKKGFETTDLAALLKRLEEDKTFAPKKVVLFGYNFDSKHLREIKEAFAQFKNKKSIEIDCEVRY